MLSCLPIIAACSILLESGEADKLVTYCASEVIVVTIINLILDITYMTKKPTDIFEEIKDDKYKKLD